MKDYLHYLTVDHEFRVASSDDILPPGAQIMNKFTPGQMVGPPEIKVYDSAFRYVIAICDPDGVNTKWGIPVIYRSAPHIK